MSFQPQNYKIIVNHASKEHGTASAGQAPREGAMRGWVFWLFQGFRSFRVLQVFQVFSEFNILAGLLTI